jgi:hypothetical protein
VSTHESHGDEDEPESERALAAILTALPARVFYLTASGKDLWCRRPYTFVFSTGQAAERFAAAMGSELDLVPIAVATTELISTEGVAALRRQAVSRVFVDPQIDPVSGDVHGQILRLETPVEERV